MGKSEIDWIQMKAEYVTTLVTLLELSEKHGISMGSLEKTSAEEHWVDERRNYREMVGRRTEDKIGAKVAEKRANQIKIGEAFEAMGLKFLTASQGQKPIFEPSSFEEAVDVVKKGSDIVTGNLPRSDRLEIVDSKEALRVIAEAMQVSLDEDYEREHPKHSEVS